MAAITMWSAPGKPRGVVISNFTRILKARFGRWRAGQRSSLVFLQDAEMTMSCSRCAWPFPSRSSGAFRSAATERPRLPAPRARDFAVSSCARPRLASSPCAAPGAGAFEIFGFKFFEKDEDTADIVDPVRYTATLEVVGAGEEEDRGPEGGARSRLDPHLRRRTSRCRVRSGSSSKAKGDRKRLVASLYENARYEGLVDDPDRGRRHRRPRAGREVRHLGRPRSGRDHRRSRRALHARPGRHHRRRHAGSGRRDRTRARRHGRVRRASCARRAGSSSACETRAAPSSP